jgi:hypothetical protein
VNFSFPTRLEITSPGRPFFVSTQNSQSSKENSLPHPSVEQARPIAEHDRLPEPDRRLCMSTAVGPGASLLQRCLCHLFLMLLPLLLLGRGLAAREGHRAAVGEVIKELSRTGIRRSNDSLLKARGSAQLLCPQNSIPGSYPQL